MLRINLVPDPGPSPAQDTIRATFQSTNGVQRPLSVVTRPRQICHENDVCAKHEAKDIRTARSKGLGGRMVLIRHALRNALIPVVSLLGVQVAFVISGSVIMEQVFGFPGMGRQLILSLSTRDYPVIQGITVVSGLFVITVNLLVDLSYGILDPRVKVG